MADQDTSWVIPCNELVTERLDEHEHEHVGLIPLQEQLEAYLKQKQGSDETTSSSPGPGRYCRSWGTV